MASVSKRQEYSAFQRSQTSFAIFSWRPGALHEKQKKRGSPVDQLDLEEVRNYRGSGLPSRAPNSMNNYGLVLNERLGLQSSLL